MNHGRDKTGLVLTSIAQAWLNEIIIRPRDAPLLEKEEFLRDLSRAECQFNQPVLEGYALLTTGSSQPFPFAVQTQKARQYFQRLLEKILDAADAHQASRRIARGLLIRGRLDSGGCY